MMEVAERELVYSTDSLSSEEILRSINIVFDADYPQRISHFFPTTKSIELLWKLFNTEDSAGKFVVAPYGSGKSLVGSFYQKLIENREDFILQLSPVISRIKQIDPELFQFIDKRARQNEIKGIVVPLVGYVADFPAAIKEGILSSLQRISAKEIYEDIFSQPARNLKELINLLNYIREKYGSARFDHLDIIWDEFGRHLEEIVLKGEARRLDELQILSEYSSRSKKISMTLALFLHQSLMRYAANIPQSVSQEWKKIEGRFETIQYIDDSKEVVSLSSRVLGARFKDAVPSERELRNEVALVKEAGLFSEFNDNEIEELIVNSWPVLPSALYVLPRISSRVAQNERTLFSFLFDIGSDTLVTPAEVYDYFSDLMRGDTTFGGTYHHWLETQSALNKTENSIQERIIKTLSLFALGLTGDRNRVNPELLSIVSHMNNDLDEIKIQIERLIQKKLLLFRKNAQSLVLWHANDIDLRGRLESEKTQLYTSFNLLEYLNQFLPPEDWRPVEYNTKKRMTRFFRGRYVSLSDLQLDSWKGEKGFDSLNEEGDGVVWYFMPENEEEIDDALNLVSNEKTDSRIVILIPLTTEGLFETALEAFALSRMLKDSSLTSEDPLVIPELNQMLDDTQAYLMRVIDKLFSPSNDGPTVVCEGKSFFRNSRSELRRFLSQQMDIVFPKTPVFNNELINKKNPKPVIVNARKKFNLVMLDFYGTKDFGIEGNRPDRSILETILLRPKLYFEDLRGRWRFARVDEISEQNLKGFWLILESFFSNPDRGERDFSELFALLKKPPYGLREGLFPIFVAIGFRAFPSAVTLIDPEGNYIPDIKPTIVEEICKNPDEFRINVFRLDPLVTEFLNKLEKVLSRGRDLDSAETDPLRRSFDALEVWKMELPAAALVSRKFTKPVLLFQDMIKRTRNPAKLFLNDMFAKYGFDQNSQEDINKLIHHVDDWCSELEHVVNNYLDSARRTIISTLQMKDSVNVREAGNQWRSVLPDNILKILTDGIEKAIIQRFDMHYDTDLELVNSLSSLIIGKRLDRWDDSTLPLFDREFRNTIRRIEDETLGSLRTENDGSSAVSDLLFARIDSLYSRLEVALGKELAREKILTIVNEQEL